MCCSVRVEVRGQLEGVSSPLCSVSWGQARVIRLGASTFTHFTQIGLSYLAVLIICLVFFGWFN